MMICDRTDSYEPNDRLEKLLDDRAAFRSAQADQGRAAVPACAEAMMVSVVILE